MISPTSSEPKNTNIPAEPTTSTSSAFAAFVLASMRVAYLQAQLAANEVAAAGIALKSGWIDAEGALAMLGEAGLLPVVEVSS